MHVQVSRHTQASSQIRPRTIQLFSRGKQYIILTRKVTLKNIYIH